MAKAAASGSWVHSAFRLGQLRTFFGAHFYQEFPHMKTLVVPDVNAAPHRAREQSAELAIEPQLHHRAAARPGTPTTCHRRR
jgi:hypothetical protein